MLLLLDCSSEDQVVALTLIPGLPACLAHPITMLLSQGGLHHVCLRLTRARPSDHSLSTQHTTRFEAVLTCA